MIDNSSCPVNHCTVRETVPPNSMNVIRFQRWETFEMSINPSHCNEGGFKAEPWRQTLMLHWRIRTTDGVDSCPRTVRDARTLTLIFSPTPAAFTCSRTRLRLDVYNKLKQDNSLTSLAVFTSTTQKTTDSQLSISNGPKCPSITSRKS